MPERNLEIQNGQVEQLHRDIAAGLRLSLDLVQSGSERLVPQGRLPS